MLENFKIDETQVLAFKKHIETVYLQSTKKM